MRRSVAALLALLMLLGCAGELSTPGEPLRLLALRLPEAFDGEAFEATLRPTGGLRPYSYEVVDGALPPGLRLEAGRIVGTPSAQGRFTFTIEARDANLNRTVQRLELAVAPLPTPRLGIDVPITELQRATELRLRFERGRRWRGAEVALRWDPERFDLDADSIRTLDRRVLAVWRVEPGLLRIDLAMIGEPLSTRSDLIAFTLTPREPSRLGLDLSAVSVAAGGTQRSDERLGAPPQPPTAPAAPAPVGQDDAAQDDAPQRDEADGSDDTREEAP